MQAHELHENAALDHRRSEFAPHLRRRADRAEDVAHLARRMLDRDVKGDGVTLADRAASRRTLVAAAQPAVRAMGEVVARSRGNGMRMGNPIQRCWRDAQHESGPRDPVPGRASTSPRDRARRGPAGPDAGDGLSGRGARRDPAAPVALSRGLVDSIADGPGAARSAHG